MQLWRELEFQRINLIRLVDATNDHLTAGSRASFASMRWKSVAQPFEPDERGGRS